LFVVILLIILFGFWLSAVEQANLAVNCWANEKYSTSYYGHDNSCPVVGWCCCISLVLLPHKWTYV